MKKVYLSHDCCFVGYSGGKDSIAMGCDFRAVARGSYKTYSYINFRVGVETPIMTAYISRTLKKIQKSADKQNLPFIIHSVRPLMKDTYWYKLLGRGVLPPCDFIHKLAVNVTTRQIKIPIISMRHLILLFYPLELLYNQFNKFDNGVLVYRLNDKSVCSDILFSIFS